MTIEEYPILLLFQYKILCYQEIYRNGNYKFLEEVIKSNLQGFRLLFLTSTETRVAALCRFIQKAQNSDFIWLSDQRRMFEHGLSANIWVRGGKYENPRESILGPKHASDFPLMSMIRWWRLSNLFEKHPQSNRSIQIIFLLERCNNIPFKV